MLDHSSGQTQSGLALDPRRYLGQSALAVEVPANMHERVKRNQHGAGENTERVLEEGVRLTLMLVPRGVERA